MRARPIAFRSDDLTLEGELVVPDAARALLVLCRGIGGHHPDPADLGYGGLARAFAGHGYAALWFSFRGCRDAPGDYSPAGWCRDLEAALDTGAAAGEVAGLRRFIVGSSAGGATAITVGATREDVAGVATLAAVASWNLDELAPDRVRFLGYLRNIGFVRDPAFPRDFDAWSGEFDDTAPDRHVEGIAPRPLLLVHGDADDVVPYAHAERLFSIAAPPKELVRIPGGAHQLRKDARAIDAVLDWLERHP